MSRVPITSQAKMLENMSHELFRLAPTYPNKGVTQEQLKPHMPHVPMFPRHVQRLRA